MTRCEHGIDLEVSRCFACEQAPASPPVPDLGDFHGNGPAPFKPVVGRPGKPVLPASPPVPATDLGMTVKVDPSMPPGEVSFRDKHGNEVGRIVNLAAPVPGAALPDAIREALDAYRDACFDLGLASGKGHATLATPERARGLVESSLRDEVSGRTRAEDQARDHLARAIRAERALAEADRDRSDLRMMLAAAVAATDTAKRDLAEARAQGEQDLATAAEFSRRASMAAKERDEARAEVERLRRAMDRIILNDKTSYRHHEARPSDGAKPSTDGGTCWLTPREIATSALSVPPGARSPGGPTNSSNEEG